jgi:hypothetical protein
VWLAVLDLVEQSLEFDQTLDLLLDYTHTNHNTIFCEMYMVGQLEPIRRSLSNAFDDDGNSLLLFL